MRRNYITSDFKSESIEGTFNMYENRSLFSSKMIDIEDLLPITNNDIIYYQNILKEQISLPNELLLIPVTYSPSESKRKWSELILVDNQSRYELDTLTKWSISINIIELLIDNIFANIKKERTFEGIVNNKTKYNDINLAITDYIKQNLISRYKIDSIILYLKYKSVLDIGNKKFNNSWNPSISDKTNILSKIETKFNYNKTNCVINFKQEKNSETDSFDYYFDVIFKKI